MNRLALSLPLVLGMACANDAGMGANAEEEREGLENGDDALDVESAPTTIRVDVYPSNALLGDSLEDGFRVLPRSSSPLVVDGGADRDVPRIQLGAPVRLTGRVEGFLLNPQVAALPGEVVPVPATVRLVLPDTVQDYIVTTDSSGDYAAWVSPQTVYERIVGPQDPSFPRVADNLPITDAASARDVGTLTVPFGPPVYGRVSSPEGPIEGAQIYVVDQRGQESAAAVSDEDGWYTVRVLPGTYDVICDGGGELSFRPELRRRNLPVDELGALLDFDYLDTDPPLVRGQVTTKADVDLSDALVRFTATDLDGYDDAEFEARWSVTARLNEGDRYLAQVMPGVYDVEVLAPEFEDADGVAVAGVSPAALTDVRITDDDDLPEIFLPQAQRVVGTVVDPDDAVVEAVFIDCTEVGFGQRQFSALTNEAGVFTQDLPAVNLICRATPTSTSGLAARSFEFVPTGDRPLVKLSTGVVLRGEVVGPDGPEAFASVNVRRSDTDAIVGTGLTDTDGRYEVRVAFP